MDRNQFFTNQIAKWSSSYVRDLPWKQDSNPYHILLSEIILQQTRVAQGLPYYQSFVQHFPTVFDFAIATEDEVLRLWQGLGYYSRARNLHQLCKKIVSDYNGVFPKDYSTWLTFKGIGPYTAAAITSFAFNVPQAVVDGNVYRVLSRYDGSTENFHTSKGKKFYHNRANELLSRSSPAIHNQAIMDLGALICKPAQPDCGLCVMRDQCIAYRDNLIHLLPVKKKKLIKRRRIFHFLDIRTQHGDVIVLQKREQKDIWQNLYQFPLIERDDANPLSLKSIQKALFSTQKETPTTIQVTGPFKQTLTHQKIVAYFYRVEMSESQFLDSNMDGKSIQLKNLHKFAFPKIMSEYLAENI